MLWLGTKKRSHTSAWRANRAQQLSHGLVWQKREAEHITDQYLLEISWSWQLGKESMAVKEPHSCPPGQDTITIIHSHSSANTLTLPHSAPPLTLFINTLLDIHTRRELLNCKIISFKQHVLNFFLIFVCALCVSLRSFSSCRIWCVCWQMTIPITFPVKLPVLHSSMF